VSRGKGSKRKKEREIEKEFNRKERGENERLLESEIALTGLDTTVRGRE